MCKSKEQGGQRCYPHAKANVNTASARVASLRRQIQEAGEEARQKPSRKSETKLAQLRQREAVARERWNNNLVALASTPTGRQEMQGWRREYEQNDVDGSNARQIKALDKRLEEGEQLRRACHAEYSKWSAREPSGDTGSTHLTREDGRVVATVRPGTQAATPVADEILATHGQYAWYNENGWANSLTAKQAVKEYTRTTREREHLTKTMGEMSENLGAELRSHGIESWRDERTGTRVDVEGGASYSQWDTDGTDAHLAQTLGQQHGMEPDATHKLIDQYRQYANVSGYHARGLRQHGINPAEYATVTPENVKAASRGNPPLPAPSGPAKGTVASATESANQGWDQMKLDEKVRTYESLVQIQRAHRTYHEAVAARIAEHADDGADLGEVTVSPGTSARKWHDKQGAHSDIRAHIAATHPAPEKATQVLEGYAQVARFGDPRVKPMKEAGLDPDRYSGNRTAPARVTLPTETKDPSPESAEQLHEPAVA